MDNYKLRYASEKYVDNKVSSLETSIDVTAEVG